MRPKMKRVLIESPFGTREDGTRCSPEEVFGNVLYAKAAVLDCLVNGESPYASHLFFPQVLKDADPHERELGIKAGLLWGEAAELTVVYTDRGITKGMEYGIKAAEELDRPIEYRSLEEYKNEC